LTAFSAAQTAVMQLPRRLRTALVTLHIVMSVGWLWLDGSLVALEAARLFAIIQRSRDDAATASAVIAWVLIPVVFISLTSGLVLALFTPWGLMRHWWVLMKCSIAAALTITGLLLLVPRIQGMAAGMGEHAELRTLIARSCALILLFVATALSVMKPWGQTPRGRKLRRAGRNERVRNTGLATKQATFAQPSHADAVMKR
jgi:hypothetical protein